MIKSILSLFLLLSLLGLASSDIFKPVSNNKGFATSTDLYGIYDQDGKSGGHQAMIYFKTKIPSVNLDQSGVSSIDCKDNKISFTANDGNAISQVNDWPDKVMLLISHKWKCSGKATTQFYMVSNKVVDVSSKKATFTMEECNIKDWSERYALDITWVDREPKKRSSLYGRKRASISKSKTIKLDILFDEKTGKSSKPNFPIIKSAQNNTGETLVCSNCFVNGEAKLGLKVAGKFFPPKLTEASISLNGKIRMNIDVAFDGKIGAAVSPPDFQILNLPLSPLSVPKLFNIDLSILLFASAKLSADLAGSLRAGGEISLPNFVANATFVGQPKFQQSGFKPVTTSHNSTTNVTVSADISGSLKPQLSFGLDVLNIFSLKTGFKVVGSLGSSISINGGSGCDKQPRIKSVINGNLGFFLRDNNFPIVDFPSITLFNQCI